MLDTPPPRCAPIPDNSTPSRDAISLMTMTSVWCAGRMRRVHGERNRVAWRIAQVNHRVGARGDNGQGQGTIEHAC